MNDQHDDRYSFDEDDGIYATCECCNHHNLMVYRCFDHESDDPEYIWLCQECMNADVSL